MRNSSNFLKYEPVLVGGADPVLIHGQLHVFGAHLRLCTAVYDYPIEYNAGWKFFPEDPRRLGAIPVHNGCTHVLDLCWMHLDALRE